MSPKKTNEREREREREKDFSRIPGLIRMDYSS
jgi:hypothetical protein